MYKEIYDYGIIGNLHSVALVGRNGSIDWCCLPYLDSPSVFAALLDEDKGGQFSICPAAEWDSVASYIQTTNILSTSFRTRTGVMVLTDFMPIVPESENPDKDSEHPDLYRLVQVTSGELEVAVDFYPRFDYARAQTVLEEGEWGVTARSEENTLALCCSRSGLQLDGDRATAHWKLSKGDFVWFYMHFGGKACERFEPEQGGLALRETESFWHGWLRRSETGMGLDLGAFRSMVERSALVLKLLQFSPTGAIAAAPTTSLPEEVGGVRNWDYRFSWVRDSALTLEALFNLGHISETENFLSWIEKLISERGSDLRVLYDLQGEEISGEEHLDHLDGYKGSRPVRIGNAAVKQRQFDIYGEIMDAALKLSRYIGKIDMKAWPFLRDICSDVVRHWREPDSGIWEMRSEPKHFVYSKVMCWVALDRGLSIARRYGFPGELDKWEETRREIRREILEKGWNEEKESFVQHYETDALDASVLLIPIFGFLPFDDHRVVSTVKAIRRELSHEDFIYRYRPHQSPDGLSGQEGVFLVCTFWLIDNLIGQGECEEAARLLHRMEHTSNHLGLFSEEFDLRWKCALGNFPQALTHIGYINSVVSLCRRRVELEASPEERNFAGLLQEKLLITSDFILNEGNTDDEKNRESGEIAAVLEKQLNWLQDAFIDSARGRVDYERMQASEIYRNYRDFSVCLKDFDPGSLDRREERLAFWINIYNILVIHGVIALGIRDSVTEVPRFFRRIRYRIGGQEYSADDIEHGILRGNSRLPHSLFHPFREGDPRLRLTVEPLERRVQFALVPASRSCPPIEIFSAEDLDRQLDLAARTFLNTGGIRIDRKKMEVHLVESFKWYGEDFGEGEEELLRFIAPFLYEEEKSRFLEEYAGKLKVRYQDYDWRLNSA